MKKWGLLVTVFYMLVLAVLTMPVIFISWAGEKSWSPFEFYGRWGYWVVIAIMGIGQLLLLFVPVQIAQRKLKSRRPLIAPVITAAFMTVVLMAVLVTFLTWTLMETEYKNIGSRCSQMFEMYSNGYTLILLILSAWIFWSVAFYKFTRDLEPDRLMHRLVSWLLKGSILELLVAIPCHIFVRRRGDCCAPIATFWGIAAGIAIMILSFGPGVFYLFVEKVKRSQRAKTSLDS